MAEFAGRILPILLLKIEETDEIFEQLATLHAQGKAEESVLRLSLDAKATVAVGPFSRHRQSGEVVKAAEHLMPFGIFLPDHYELYLYFTSGRLTADFVVDCLLEFWTLVKVSFPQVKTLLLNLDNGPENHSRRSQFRQRSTEFVVDIRPIRATVRKQYRRVFQGDTHLELCDPGKPEWSSGQLCRGRTCLNSRRC